jgi:protein-S-isoprenylcysteine O-methyltransferase Ste14
MANPLTEALPAKVRQIIYVAFAVAGVGVGATQVGYASANIDQPTWLNVTLAVFAFLGTALGITAASNIRKPDANDGPESEPRRALVE